MGGCRGPERRRHEPRVSGTAGLGTGVPVSALALDPNQVLRTRGWSPPKSPSEVFLSLWTARESCPQGAAMEPPPRPLSRSHSHHCSRPASRGSQQGGRAPQGARSPFRGTIRAGEALSYVVGLFNAQHGNPKRRHTEAKGRGFQWFPESPRQALLHGPSPSPQGQLWPGGWMLSLAQRSTGLSQAQFTRAAGAPQAALPFGAPAMTSPLRRARGQARAQALHPS